jgi:hypothetical protein
MSGMYVRFENHFRDFDNLDWNARFKRHTDFANKQLIKGDYGYTVLAKDLQSKAARDQYKQGLKGYWLISCDEIEKRFGCDDLRLSVRIQSAKDKAVGHFDWGCLEGIMHFNHDPSRLPHNFRDESPSSDEDELDDESETDEDEPDDESETNDVFVEMDYLRSQISDLRDQLKTAQSQLSTLHQTLVTAKTFEELQATLREIKPSGETQAGGGVTKHKRSISNSAETPITKRTKFDTPANRLYFVWRGHYKRPFAEDIPWDDGQNTGYIEFTVADTLEFNGVISGAALGVDIPFKGYRISCDGSPPNKKNWEYYSFLPQ